MILYNFNAKKNLILLVHSLDVLSIIYTLFYDILETSDKLLQVNCLL